MNSFCKGCLNSQHTCWMAERLKLFQGLPHALYTYGAGIGDAFKLKDTASEFSGMANIIICFPSGWPFQKAALPSHPTPPAPPAQPGTAPHIARLDGSHQLRSKMQLKKLFSNKWHQNPFRMRVSRFRVCPFLSVSLAGENSCRSTSCKLLTKALWLFGRQLPWVCYQR